ncbi:hypothetical protein ACH4FX_34860 [Streptomyces sp. NPDC018019]|uniref:hypothetical protein n=1 Tax=Streptomyces sp. NPDC018019 TaxID=3365030 RepID=UPI0037A9FB07
MDEQRAEEAVGGGIPTRIGQAVMLHRAGDREEARNRLAQLWAEVGPDGDPFHRCTLAHYLADTQDDPADELRWDLRALETAQRHLPRRSVPAVAALLPSLHLSLAADYAALGRPAEARAQLARAHETATVLGDDAYGRDVRQAIERLRGRVADGGGGDAGADRTGGVREASGGGKVGGGEEVSEAKEANGARGVGGAGDGDGPCGAGAVGDAVATGSAVGTGDVDDTDEADDTGGTDGGARADG